MSPVIVPAPFGGYEIRDEQTDAKLATAETAEEAAQLLRELRSDEDSIEDQDLLDALFA